jgi:nicotinate-nucleotide--dimethylbenzimidazole phosphoribosyltransferase
MNQLQELLGKISDIDCQLMDKTQIRLDNLTKPQGSLGRLEELAKLIVGITGRENPQLNKKVIFTFVGDHGVVAEGVSAFPQAVTEQMVYNFINGGAGINVLARQVGAKVIIADLGVVGDLKVSPGLIIRKIAPGTKNMVKEPAMTKNQVLAAVRAGQDIFETELSQGIDIIGTGEMGIGNTTASSAIVAVLTGKPVAQVTGRGTGITDAALANKIRVIETAIKINQPDPQDPLDVLAKVGGLEIAGLVGVILSAAAHSVPVVVDGFISSAAALVAYKLSPQVKNYLISAHVSVESGQKAILDFIGLNPLLDLKFRLGEGTGAALGIGLAEAAVKILTEMASFSSAGVLKSSES